MKFLDQTTIMIFTLPDGLNNQSAIGIDYFLHITD